MSGTKKKPILICVSDEEEEQVLEREKGKRILICESDDDEEQEEEEEQVSEREKKKRILICVSDEGEESSEREDLVCVSDEEEDEEGSSAGFSEAESDVGDTRSDDDGNNVNNDLESLCNRVVFLLKERGDLGALNIQECKAYLRKHGLRVSGTKDVCIQRIEEHWRIRDGNGEALYPKSSFVVDCTGDVCQGDVVMFRQKVYEKFDKMTRHGRGTGYRSVAGRVVHESYGAAKQQHTFTVEILWSKGINKLPPLFPLLVKGRNLYKRRTFRQRWNNEAERVRVLSEKHERGSAARSIRAMRKKNKGVGAKRQKHSHHTRSSQMRKTTECSKRKSVDGVKKAMPPRAAKRNSHHQEAPPLRNVKLKRNGRSRKSQSSRSNEKSHHLNSRKGPALQSYKPLLNHCQSQIEFHRNSALSCYPGHDMACISTIMRSPHFNTSQMPTSQHPSSNYSNYIHHGYSNEEFEPIFRVYTNVDRASLRFPSGTDATDRRSVFSPFAGRI